MALTWPFPSSPSADDGDDALSGYPSAAGERAPQPCSQVSQVRCCWQPCGAAVPSRDNFSNTSGGPSPTRPFRWAPGNARRSAVCRGSGRLLGGLVARSDTNTSDASWSWTWPVEEGPGRTHRYHLAVGGTALARRGDSNGERAVGKRPNMSDGESVLPGVGASRRLCSGGLLERADRPRCSRRRGRCDHAGDGGRRCGGMQRNRVCDAARFESSSVSGRSDRGPWSAVGGVLGSCSAWSRGSPAARRPRWAGVKAPHLPAPKPPPRDPGTSPEPGQQPLHQAAWTTRAQGINLHVQDFSQTSGTAPGPASAAGPGTALGGRRPSRSGQGLAPPPEVGFYYEQPPGAARRSGERRHGE